MSSANGGAAGTPLLTVDDMSKLEVVIELLSPEAVKFEPGMPIILDGWGGSQPLKARAQRVEPYAFTKVSALGIGETSGTDHAFSPSDSRTSP